MTVDVMFCAPDLGDGSHVRDLGIPTVSDSGIHHATAIVVRMSSASDLRHGVPVAGREVRQVALVALGLPRFPAAVPAD